MQKFFNSPELKKYYDEKRDLYLSVDNMYWFVSQRNAVTKQEPFKLEKGIRVERNQIFSPQPVENGSKINWLQPLYDSLLKL
jgi:hypothetical protein